MNTVEELAQDLYQRQREFLLSWTGEVKKSISPCPDDYSEWVRFKEHIPTSVDLPPATDLSLKGLEDYNKEKAKTQSAVKGRTLFFHRRAAEIDPLKLLAGMYIYLREYGNAAGFHATKPKWFYDWDKFLDRAVTCDTYHSPPRLNDELAKYVTRIEYIPAHLRDSIPAEILDQARVIASAEKLGNEKIARIGESVESVVEALLGMTIGTVATLAIAGLILWAFLAVFGFPLLVLWSFLVD